ncbi:STAS domain-containing protein [Aneurinibacillus sp. REN35]|uniref:STAS domain-containing protein n=1 Tax=Aneurinibacillus sp. REN35 TaxID=3237286 RepID=UPI003528A357
MSTNENDVLREEIIQLRNELEEYKQMIEHISVPIIPSIIPETNLVPITGKLTAQRLEMIISTIIESPYNKNVTTIVVDFTGVTTEHIQGLDLGIFGSYIQKLTSTLRLMGIQTLFTGFSPAIARELIHLEETVYQKLKTFLNFSYALTYLMKQKKLSLQKSKD